MQDHFYFSIIVRTEPDVSASDLYNRVDLLQAAEDLYSANSSGPLTTPVGPTYGFRQLSVHELKSAGADHLIPNQTDQAHIEYLWENVYYPAYPSDAIDQYPPNKNETFNSVTAALLTPASRGNVSLKSNSIQDGPVINMNYLADPADQQLALLMFRSLRTIISQPGLSQYSVGPDHGEVVPGADITDDVTLLEYIKSTLLPVWHASGTCRMMPKEDGGVVDERLRVYGVNGLRIVDASIIPIVPDQHTQGPVYMIAEHAADMIKEDYALGS